MPAALQIGNVKVGSQHPIALQTMTTTDTRNVQATVDQVWHTIHNLLIPDSYKSENNPALAALADCPLQMEMSLTCSGLWQAV